MAFGSGPRVFRSVLIRFDPPRRLTLKQTLFMTRSVITLGARRVMTRDTRESLCGIRILRGRYRDAANKSDDPDTRKE